MISNKKKALIHIAKAETGMSEDEYRDLLNSYGIRSSADRCLTNATFNRIMDRFRELGFKSKSQTRQRKTKKLPISKRNLMKKLEAIILDMDLTWAYVDAIAKKRFGVDRAQWLEVDDLYKLVQMMVIHQKRERRA